MKKANSVPRIIVSVNSEIERARDLLLSDEGFCITPNGSIIDPCNGALYEESPQKPSFIDQGIVSTEEDQEFEEIIEAMNGDTDEANEYLEEAEPQKPSFVEKGIVSVEELHNTEDSIEEFNSEERGTDLADNNQISYREMLESDKPVVINNDGTLDWEVMSDDINKPSSVPKIIVSARQWYQDNPKLLMLEREAMRKFQGDRAKFGIRKKDGKAYWDIKCRPIIPGKKLSECRTYTIRMLYDSDHPKKRYGTSVRAYLKKPTIEQLQDIVNKSRNVSPKRIPHLIKDEENNLFLCSADTANVSDDYNSGVTSAATSLRYALRWIIIFELGLMDPETWNLFQQHGKI